MRGRRCVLRVYLFTCVLVYVCTCFLHNFQNNTIRLRRVDRAMDSDAVFDETRAELFDVLIETLDHVRADSVRALAARLPIGQGRERGGAHFQSALGVGV